MENHIHIQGHMQLLMIQTNRTPCTNAHMQICAPLQLKLLVLTYASRNTEFYQWILVMLLYEKLCSQHKKANRHRQPHYSL